MRFSLYAIIKDMFALKYLICEKFITMNKLFYILIFICSWSNFASILQGFKFFHYQKKMIKKIIKWFNINGFSISNTENSLALDLYNFYLGINDGSSKIYLQNNQADIIFDKHDVKKYKAALFLHLNLCSYIYGIYFLFCFLNKLLKNNTYFYSFYAFIILSPLVVFLCISNIFASINFQAQEVSLSEELNHFENLLKGKLLKE